MKPTVLDTDLFLTKLVAGVSAGRVVVEPYATRRAFEEMGWRPEDIIEFLPCITRDDVVRNEPERQGRGLIWMFQPYVEDFGNVWIEFVLLGDVFVVSFHPSDGEGEP